MCLQGRHRDRREEGGAPPHSTALEPQILSAGASTSSSGCRTKMGAAAHTGDLLARSGHSLIVGMMLKGEGPGALLVGTQERCAGRPAPGTQGPSPPSCLGGAVRACRPLMRGGLEGGMEGVLAGGRWLQPARQTKIHSRRQRKSEAPPSGSHRGRRCVPTTLAARSPCNVQNGGTPPMHTAVTAEELV